MKLKTGKESRKERKKEVKLEQGEIIFKYNSSATANTFLRETSGEFVSFRQRQVSFVM